MNEERDFAWVGELMREGGLVRRRDEGGGTSSIIYSTPKSYSALPLPLACSALLCSALCL